jgi:anaerobic dimethyl sulfoxide reductase subunit A
MSSETVITTTCAPHCGGGCLLKVHVKDGIITRIEADDDSENIQVRACLRGRSWRQRIYHPDRLKHPMKRVGPRCTMAGGE